MDSNRPVAYVYLSSTQDVELLLGQGLGLGRMYFTSIVSTRWNFMADLYGKFCE
jgi:hypothetical protein